MNGLLKAGSWRLNRYCPMIVLRTLICSAIYLVLLSSPASRATPSDSSVSAGRGDHLWRQSRSCGLNSLFLMMRAKGMAVDYDELEKVVPIGLRGSTLPQLRDAADRLGFHTTIVRATPADLAKCPLPAIAHLEPEGFRSGHYVLVTGLGENHVSFIDGSTAIMERMNTETFRRQWSGYLLLPGRVRPWWLSWVISLTGGSLMILGYWWFRSR